MKVLDLFEKIKNDAMISLDLTQLPIKSLFALKKIFLKLQALTDSVNSNERYLGPLAAVQFQPCPYLN